MSVRLGVVALVVTMAVGVFAVQAAAKLPQLRFERPGAAAGVTVSAVINPWSSPLERFRFFLVHSRDLAALLPPEHRMLFGKRARAATEDDRLIEIDPAAVAGSETRDGWITVDIAIPEGIRKGRYTTAAFVCDPGCVFEPALTAYRLAHLSSIGRWDQRLALRVR